jgi:phage-related protein
MGLPKLGVEAIVEGVSTYLKDMDRLGKATNEAADQTEKAAKRSEGLSKALSGVGKIVAGLGLAGLFGAMIAEASESEQKVTELNAVLKSTGGIAGVTAKQALDLATAFQKTTRFSDEAVLSGENMLLTFTNIGKDIFPQAAEAVLDYATKFGSVEQASIAIGKALQDPISGVTALRRVGVMLTDQQEEQIKTFMKAGQIQKAQAVILKELQTEFGGLAVAMGKTFAGKLDILKNKFSDVLETVGGYLLPVLEDLLDWVSNFIEQLGPAAPAILTFAAAIGALALAAGPLGAVLGIILSPIGAIVAAVAALGLAFSTNFLGIRDIVESVWKFIGPIITAIGADLSGIFAGLTQGFDIGVFLSDLGWQLKHGLEILFAKLGIDFHIVQKIIDAFASIGNYVQSTLFPALGQFFTWLGGIWNTVAPKLGELVTWFTETAIPAVLTFITDTIIPGIQTLIDTVIRIWTDVSPFLTELFNWFVNDALPAIGGTIDWFVKNVATPLIDLLKGLWEVVRPALESLFNWFVKDGLPAIKQIATDLWEKVLKPLAELLRDLWEKFAKPGLEALAKFFREEGPKIGQFISETIGKAFDALLTVVRAIVDWVGQAIAKIRELLGLQGPMGVMSAEADKLSRSGLNIPGRDSGGPGVAGQAYMIGRGAQPELFMPSSSGQFFPNFNRIVSSLMAQPAPAYAPASSYATNTYNNQQSMGDIVMNGVQGTSDAMRRYALLRAMGRVR